MDAPKSTLERKQRALDNDKAIGILVRQHRVARHLRQIDVARAFGCSQTLISRLENGQRGLRYSEVELLASALGMTAEELFAALRIIRPR